MTYPIILISIWAAVAYLFIGTYISHSEDIRRGLRNYQKVIYCIFWPFSDIIKWLEE